MVEAVAAAAVAVAVVHLAVAGTVVEPWPDCRAWLAWNSY